MQQVFTRENRFEVMAMRALLESYDIHSVLKNEHASSVMGEVPFFEVWPELWVSDAVVDQAKALIKEAQRDVIAAEEWVCAQCDEENPGTFELCWQCSNIRQQADSA